MNTPLPNQRLQNAAPAGYLPAAAGILPGSLINRRASEAFSQSFVLSLDEEKHAGFKSSTQGGTSVLVCFTKRVRKRVEKAHDAHLEPETRISRRRLKFNSIHSMEFANHCGGHALKDLILPLKLRLGRISTYFGKEAPYPAACLLPKKKGCPLNQLTGDKSFFPSSYMSGRDLKREAAVPTGVYTQTAPHIPYSQVSHPGIICE